MDETLTKSLKAKPKAVAKEVTILEEASDRKEPADTDLGDPAVLEELKNVAYYAKNYAAEKDLARVSYNTATTFAKEHRRLLNQLRDLSHSFPLLSSEERRRLEEEQTNMMRELANMRLELESIQDDVPSKAKVNRSKEEITLIVPQKTKKVISLSKEGRPKYGVGIGRPKSLHLWMNSSSTDKPKRTLRKSADT